MTLGSGVIQPAATMTSFILNLEDRHSTEAPDDVSKRSLPAHQVSLMLLYPASVFVVDSHDPSVVKSLSTTRTLLLNQPLPCNIHLIGFRTLTGSNLQTDLPSNSALLTLHNRGYDCSIPANTPHCEVPSQPGRAFHPPVEWTGLHLNGVEAMTLTGLQSLGAVDLDSIRIPPMEIASFNVTFT